jgi:hypothetical protein
VLSTASFGILSLPILIAGLIAVGMARSQWARWSGLTAALTVVGVYVFVRVTGR